MLDTCTSHHSSNYSWQLPSRCSSNQEKKEYQQHVQQIKKKIPMIQPWFCSHYPISIFLPLGSRLIILCLFQTQLSIPIQNFFFIFVPLPMQNGKLTLSSQFFPSLLLEVSTTQQQIHFPNLHDTLKHFLKNSTIAYLLEGQTSDHFIHRAQVNTFPCISVSSQLQQAISANPH